jgi:hypothetical protein
MLPSFPLLVAPQQLFAGNGGEDLDEYFLVLCLEHPLAVLLDLSEALLDPLPFFKFLLVAR